MSTSSAGVPTGLMAGTRRRRVGPTYFFSDGTRTVQTILGLIWLLDGGLQFQSFMYSKGFIDMLTSMSPGQPHWLGSSINWGANLAAGNISLYNTGFALVQVAIGLGLLYRPTVKSALLLSFVWSLFVWWFGEGFGMLFMNMAQPLTGAPGGVIMYALIGLVIWPNGNPGGLLGVRGTRIMWATLWLLCAYLWLLQSSASANAIHDMINAAPSGMSWLSSMQDGFASITKGDGFIFALILAVLSAVIGLGVGFNWRAKELLIVSVVLQVIFWLVGQGLGGIFQGGATDPATAPLLILLAYAVYQLIPYRLHTTATAAPAV
ncbi:MAG TPA: hypothetical protein VHV75_15100 [Solirubrobacteraceae bacterium]|jgi:hypothetical protein|nr:hypothetical protein [Solirubrobacteraceae bacterium]